LEFSGKVHKNFYLDDHLKVCLKVGYNNYMCMPDLIILLLSNHVLDSVL